MALASSGMVTHDDELGGLMCETRMFEGLRYLISLAARDAGEASL